MSGVLRLSCSIENERVRSATKDFANILENLFELHQKIVERYLNLVQYCEDSNIMCPLLHSKLEECKNNDTVKSAELPKPTAEASNQVLEQATKTPLPMSINVSAVYTPDLDFQSDGNSLSDSNTECKVISQDELLKSPVLIKKRSKTRRSDTTPNRLGLENASGNSEHMCLDSGTATSRDKPLENKFKQSAHLEEDNNNDEIENTPVPKKLGVSKLYHVDSTLLKSGKILKQSKLILLPLQEGRNTTVTNLESPVASTSLIPKNNSHKLSNSEKRQNKPLDEDIIESSPKRAEKQLKMNRLKLKRTTPKNPVRKLSVNDSIKKLDSERSPSRVVNKPLKDITFANMSQLSPPMHSSTQREEPQLIRRLRTVCSLSSDRGIESDCSTLDSPQSPVLVDIEKSVLGYVESSTLRELGNREHGIEICAVSAQKRKFSESIDTSLTFEDETFFSLKEKDKKEEDYGLHASDFEEEFTLIKAESSSPPVKRSLITSFDIVPSKEDAKINYAKPGKSKAERAKMDGRSCWECKQYYQDLGLSEKEIQMRQNQCSRHRTKFKERQNTPEGFWDPVFPDTQSSTLQDN